MVEVARDVDEVAWQVLGHDVIGQAGVCFAGEPGQVEAVPLADGVENRAVVGAEDPVAFDFADLAGLGGEVVLQEVAQVDVPDETEAHGFLFVGVGQAGGRGELLNGRFAELAEWEKGVVQGRLRNAIEEVGLVLVLVHGAAEERGGWERGVCGGRTVGGAAEERGGGRCGDGGVEWCGGAGFASGARRREAVCVWSAGWWGGEALGVVAGGDVIGAGGEGAFEEKLELNLLVADDVRVGGAAGAGFAQEVVDDVLAVFCLEIPDRKIDTEAHRYALGVGQVLGPGALHAG